MTSTGLPMRSILINDTTLRDGEQQTGIIKLAVAGRPGTTAPPRSVGPMN